MELLGEENLPIVILMVDSKWEKMGKRRQRKNLPFRPTTLRGDEAQLFDGVSYRGKDGIWHFWDYGVGQLPEEMRRAFYITLYLLAQRRISRFPQASLESVTVRPKPRGGGGLYGLCSDFVVSKRRHDYSLRYRGVVHALWAVSRY